MHWLAVQDPSTTFSFWDALIQWGPGGIVCLLFIFRWIEPKGARKDLNKEKDSWKNAFLTEQEAHLHTREALAKAEERADVAMEIAKPLTSVLHQLGHNSGDRSN